jgi:hypothetical protein
MIQGFYGTSVSLPKNRTGRPKHHRARKQVGQQDTLLETVERWQSKARCQKNLWHLSRLI